MEGSRGSGGLEKTSHDDSRGETALREEERLGSRHLRVVQRHLLFLPYDPYEIRYLRSLPPSPFIYLSVSREPGQRGATHTRPACTGCIIRHVIPAPRDPPFAYSASSSLSSDSRTLLRDRRECLHLSPPAAYASPDASHKERFIVWRPPGARWTRREFLPRHSRVAAGDKTPTKPALLITAGMTGPICIRAAFAAAALSESRRKKEKREKRRRSSDGHRRDHSSLQREEISSS